MARIHAIRWLLLAAFLILPRWIYMATLEHTEPRYVVEFFPFLSVLGGIAISCFFGANQISVVDRICRVKDPDMEAINGRLSPLRPGVASSYNRRGETQEICFPLLP